MFEPSRYSYGDTASAVEALAPLAIAAGTEVAETAITRRRPKHRRHPAGAAPPPPPEPEHSPMWPIAGAIIAAAGVGYLVLSKPKKAA